MFGRAPIPTDLRPASEWWAENQRRDPEGFAKLYPEPFLVETSVRTYGGAQTFQTRPGVEAFEIMIQEGYAREVKPEAKVFRVRKVTKTFPGKISIGRAKNVDVMIPDGDLSKFHALIAIEGERSAMPDAAATNGTFVNGRRLEAGEARPLRDDDLIWFGPRISFRFLRPLTFHARLVAMAAARGA